jgi:hypothetical protein
MVHEPVVGSLVISAELSLEFPHQRLESRWKMCAISEKKRLEGEEADSRDIYAPMAAGPS